MNHKKLGSIQILRGIAALLVLLSHLLVVEQKYSIAPILPNFFTSGIAGVDIFFVISGYIMVTVTRNKFQLTNNTIEFLYYRITRIYPLYWIYTTLALVIFFIKPSWVNHGAEFDLLSSYLLFPHSTPPLLALGWTLTHEMYFYLVFASFLLFPKRFLPAGLLLWGMIVVLLPHMIPVEIPLLRLVLSPLTCEFIAGALLALMGQHVIVTQKNLKYLFMIIVLISFLVIGIGYGLSVNLIYVSLWWRLLVLGLPALLIVYSFIQMEACGLVFSRFLIAIGDASYSIYLSHIFIISSLGRMLYPLATHSFVQLAMGIFLAVAAIVFGLVSYYLLEKTIQSRVKDLWLVYTSSGFRKRTSAVNEL